MSSEFNAQADALATAMADMSGWIRKHGKSKRDRDIGFELTSSLIVTVCQCALACGNDMRKLDKMRDAMRRAMDERGIDRADFEANLEASHKEMKQ